MRRFLVSSLLLHICALVDPSRKSTGWFVVGTVSNTVYGSTVSHQRVGRPISRLPHHRVVSGQLQGAQTPAVR